MQPSSIAQYKRSATNKETYVLTSGDAREFCRVYPTSGKRRVSFATIGANSYSAGKVYVTFGGYGGVHTRQCARQVNRFGKDASIQTGASPRTPNWERGSTTIAGIS